MTGIPTTTAAFDGECPECIGAIDQGDRIGLLDGAWCCETCVNDATRNLEDIQ